MFQSPYSGTGTRKCIAKIYRIFENQTLCNKKTGGDIAATACFCSVFKRCGSTPSVSFPMIYSHQLPCVLNATEAEAVTF